MLYQHGHIRRKKKLFLWTLCAIITITTASVIYYEAMKHYMHYYVLPRQTKNGDTTKIIFLWTPMQNNYKEWSWGIGPEPNIEDCNDPSIDGRCLITTHVDLIDRADVILFSIQDIKQVSYLANYICYMAMIIFNCVGSS